MRAPPRTHDSDPLRSPPTSAATSAAPRSSTTPFATRLRTRTFTKAPLASFTIVATVGLGLGLVTVLFSFLNIFLFRVDNVPDINEMFAVERPRDNNDEWQRFTRPQFEAMARETSVFAGVFAEVATSIRASTAA